MTNQNNTFYENLVSRAQQLSADISRDHKPGEFDLYTEKVCELRRDLVANYNDMSYQERKSAALLIEQVRGHMRDRIDVFRARDMRKILEAREESRRKE